jgi:hypothetical protein
MAQGKRLVRRDEATGRLVVHAPDKAGATFIRNPQTIQPSPVFEQRVRPLEDLRTDVRSLAAKPASTPGSKPGAPTGGTR